MTSFSTTITNTGVAVAVVVVVVAIVAISMVVVVARAIFVGFAIYAIAGTGDSSGKRSEMFNEKADNFSLGVNCRKSRNRWEGGFNLGSRIFKVNAGVVNHFLDLSFNSSARDNILSPCRMDGDSF